METRKLARYKIDPRIFEEIIKEGVTFFHGDKIVKVESGIPSDAKLAGFNTDKQENIINLFFEHESFDEVKQGAEVPIHIATLSAIKKDR